MSSPVSLGKAHDLGRTPALFRPEIPRRGRLRRRVRLRSGIGRRGGLRSAGFRSLALGVTGRIGPRPAGVSFGRGSSWVGPRQGGRGSHGIRIGVAGGVSFVTAHAGAGIGTFQGADQKIAAPPSRRPTGKSRHSGKTIWEVFEEERLSRVPYVAPFDGFHAVPEWVSKTCLVRFKPGNRAHQAGSLLGAERGSKLRAD